MSRRSLRKSGVTDFFPRGSVSRRINAEPAIICGAGRALLLQVAHPAVAQGVADHSDFRDNPFRRLQGTLEALNAVVYGSDALAFAVGRRVAQLHDHVVGETYRVKRSDGRHHYKHSTKRCNDHLNPQQFGARWVAPYRAIWRAHLGQPAGERSARVFWRWVQMSPWSVM